MERSLIIAIIVACTCPQLWSQPHLPGLEISNIQAEAGEGAGLRFICTRFKVKNTSNRIFPKVDVRVHYLGKDGRPFYSKRSSVAWDSSTEENGPILPGYSRMSTNCIEDTETDISEWKKEFGVRIESFEPK